VESSCETRCVCFFFGGIEFFLSTFMSSWHFHFWIFGIFWFSSVLGEEDGVEGLLWYLGGCWVEEWEKRGGGDENGGMGGRRGWRDGGDGGMEGWRGWRGWRGRGRGEEEREGGLG